MTLLASTLAAVLIPAACPPWPEPGDMRRFAPPEFYWEGYYFAADHCRYLEKQLYVDPRRDPYLRAWLTEAYYLRDTWYLAWQATGEPSDEPGFEWTLHYQEHLQRELIRAIGWDAYWRAELPPPVPVWRFNQLKR